MAKIFKLTPENIKQKRESLEESFNAELSSDEEFSSFLDKSIELENMLREYARGLGFKPYSFYTACLLGACGIAEYNKESKENVFDDLNGYWDLLKYSRSLEKGDSCNT